MKARCDINGFRGNANLDGHFGQKLIVRDKMGSSIVAAKSSASSTFLGHWLETAVLIETCVVCRRKHPK